MLGQADVRGLLNTYRRFENIFRLAAEIYSDIEEMKNIMIDGMCHFVFTKVNGEHRDAYGTRASDIIERYENKEKSPSKRKPAFNGTFSYFDLERRDWRCFRVDTLVELDRDYVV